MRSQAEKQLATDLKSRGNTYEEIGFIMNISKDAARNLCRKSKKDKIKPGPKPKLTKYNVLCIKREVLRLRAIGEKVNSMKIRQNCHLPISRRTTRRYLSTKLHLQYKKIPQKMVLTYFQQRNRLCHIENWMNIGHNWYQTVFTDEKVFILDGPNDYKTYIMKNESISRQKRICGGGKIMVWLMTLPNGLIAYKTIRGSFNSSKFIDLLRDSMLSIMKLNLKTFWLQFDNSRVHTAKVVQVYLETNNVNIVSWPPYSPDINIVEDVWSIMTEYVYDGHQFANCDALEKKISECIDYINTYRRNDIINLYSTMGRRLMNVISKKGGLCNK